MPQAQTDLAFDALATGVVLFGAAGLAQAVNPSAGALLAPADARGRSLAAILSLAGWSGGAELVAALADRRATPAIRLVRDTGQTLEARLQPLGDGGAVLSLHDITGYLDEVALAGRDSLTGLENRAALLQQLADHLAAAKPAGPAAVLYLDLDRFKDVNDTLGHPVGDALLRKVTDRLRSVVDADDALARFGGDEFCIVQTGRAQPQAAETLAARLVDLIGRTYVIGGHAVNIGASIGIAVAPVDGEDPELLLQRADQALYRAKAEGRGAFRFFQESMDVSMQARRLLEIDLRRALAMKQLAVVYQPQINITENRLVGFEALVRWHHPVRGTVSPGEFIPLAEEIGIINQIGEWVLRTATQQAASWPVPATIGVNVSPLQFRDGKLLQVVTSALAASGLDPQRLDLEITEGALLDSTQGVFDTLRALKGLGVGISMDDFGTGYSSLGYLRQFPFDKLKIDQSFVRSGGINGEANSIVRAVAAMGASLGMRTVAEGVETDEQLAQVRAAGCTDVQGYLTGRPVPAADLAAIISRFSPGP